MEEVITTYLGPCDETTWGVVGLPSTGTGADFSFYNDWLVSTLSQSLV